MPSPQTIVAERFAAVADGLAYATVAITPETLVVPEATVGEANVAESAASAIAAETEAVAEPPATVSRMATLTGNVPALAKVWVPRTSNPPAGSAWMVPAPVVLSPQVIEAAKFAAPPVPRAVKLASFTPEIEVPTVPAMLAGEAVIVWGTTTVPEAVPVTEVSPELVTVTPTPNEPGPLYVFVPEMVYPPLGFTAIVPGELVPSPQVIVAERLARVSSGMKSERLATRPETVVVPAATVGPANEVESSESVIVEEPVATAEAPARLSWIVAFTAYAPDLA